MTRGRDPNRVPCPCGRRQARSTVAGRPLRAVLIALLLACALARVPAPSQAGEPVVRAVLFWHEACSYCHVVLEEVLPPLQERYGSQLEVRALDIAQPQNFEILLRLEEHYSVPPEKGVVPEMFIGDRVLFGLHEIRDELPLLIEEFLKQGGTGWPVGLIEGPTPPPTPSAVEAATPAIHLAYLHDVGCQECERAQHDLRYLQSKYPQLEVHQFDVRQEVVLAEWLGERNQVPLGRRLTAPAVFVGADVLLGTQVNARNLEALIERYLEAGSEAYWVSQADLAAAEASILHRFHRFGALTVVAAGLLDGLNPCALATVVFFISYLSFVGRKGREILLVGAMFALGVFLTYLGVGVGLLKFLAALPFLPAISRYLYGVTALLCLILAAGSLHDWYQSRRGRHDEVRLKLPVGLRKRINQVIRRGANVRAAAAVALVTGAVVSLIELACTGQVYLPTIIFVLGVPALRARAYLYLLFYNLLFVLPLVVVLLLAYWGTTSERLASLVNRRMAAIKLATAGLFLLLGGWMVVML